MGRRRLGRETAFKALYRIDLMGKEIEDALADVSDDQGRDVEALGFARDLLETIGAHRPEVDERLRQAAPNWELERMGAVDRSILRLGIAEILYWKWIPDRVSIDEYVEIAKKYGTERSSGFVNAILDRIARDGPRTESEARESA